MSTTLTVGAIVDVVRKKAQDESDYDFTDSELLVLYNLTLRKIVSMQPKASSKNVSRQLSAGSLQQIPADGLQLISVRRNMGTDGTTPGAAITEVDVLNMNDLYPDWSTDSQTSAIQHFMRSIHAMNEFYSYPPNDGTGYAEIEYSYAPAMAVYDAAGAWESEKIPLNDDYVNAVPDGMLYMIYDDDSDYPGTSPRSQMYFQRFVQQLGLDISIKDAERQKVRG
jgi:hypothetical protein